MVYEIVDEPGAIREREGGKSGKRQAARHLVRGTGRQTAVHGNNYTVEWEKQKRGKESRGDVEGGELRGRRGSSEGETGKDGKDGEDIDRGAVPILGGGDGSVRGGVAESAIGGATEEVARAAARRLGKRPRGSAGSAERGKREPPVPVGAGKCRNQEGRARRERTRR